MTTYALIAKYQKQQSVYYRQFDNEGNVTAKGRVDNFANYALARKYAEAQSFVLVKSWKDAEAHFAEQLEAQAMTPEQPLVFTNFAAAMHRAKTDDGMYLIERWHMNDEGNWVAGRIGHKNTQDWVMTFEPDGCAFEKVEWSNPEKRHTLGAAKESCQHHANARLLKR
jgi:hypothetical protein